MIQSNIRLTGTVWLIKSLDKTMIQSVLTFPVSVETL